MFQILSGLFQYSRLKIPLHKVIHINPHLIISDPDKMEESVLAQGLINLPAPYLGIGTYAILPMKSMHSQHYKAVKPEKENEGRLYSLFQSKETTPYPKSECHLYLT